MLVPIAPVPAYPKQAVAIKIDDVHVTLDTGANAQWQLVDEDGSGVSQPDRCALTDEQYAQWGSDDAYFCACIIENVGLKAA